MKAAINVELVLQVARSAQGVQADFSEASTSIVLETMKDIFSSGALDQLETACAVVSELLR